MHHPRKFANAVNLPDGSILVTGGGQDPGHGNMGQEVLTPEVFRGTVWEECAPETSPRTYHSGTLMLPSGRVATLGGDSRTYDLQVFEPHYFSTAGTQPVITSSPATVGYNTTFDVSYTLASGRSLQSACLITPGSVTHGHDPNQRLVELGIVYTATGTTSLLAPTNPTKAPYGHYMLFLVDSAGQVSAAAWTQLL